MLDAKGGDKLIPLIIHDRWKDPEVRNLPLIPEVIKAKSGKEGLAIYNAWAVQMEFQRPFTVPPGTPRERLNILRKAFADTMKDPEFLAEAKKSRLTIRYVSGEDIEKLVDKIFTVPEKAKEELRLLITKKKKRKKP